MIKNCDCLWPAEIYAMVSQSGLKHLSNTMDQNINNNGIYNLSFYWVLKFSNKFKKILLFLRLPVYFITAKHWQILTDSFVIMRTNSKVSLDKRAVLNRPVKHASTTQLSIASSVGVKSWEWGYLIWWYTWKCYFVDAAIASAWWRHPKA